jgi:predicted transposase YdaD
MSKRFDATVKGMLERGPSDWAALAGFPGLPVEVTDADVSTVSAASDKVLRVGGAAPWLVDINFQAGPDASVPKRVHLYNALLEDRHDLLVHSVVVLLCPRANLAAINGSYVRQFEGKRPHLTFEYQVIRVWEWPIADLLTGGLGTLPLAPISNVREEDLPGIIGQMKARLDVSQGPLAAELWTATYILMGLRYEGSLINHLLRGVIPMEESVTYQAIIEEGKAQGRQQGVVEEARRTLLLVGNARFGPPRADVVAVLDTIDNRERLEELHVRLLKVSSWEELLELP